MLQDLHTIGENAFAKCRSLEKFYLRECVTHIDAGAFNVGDSSVQFQVLCKLMQDLIHGILIGLPMKKIGSFTESLWIII